MGLRINTNIEAIDAQRNLQLTSMDFQKAIQRLSSGLRINSAGDDPAGLALSETLTSQVNGFDQAQRNIQDGISLTQVAGGALNETSSLLQRLRQLAVQSSTATLTSSDRTNIQAEVNSILTEINRVANTTEFNTRHLLDGSAGAAVVNAGGGDISGVVAQGNVALTGVTGIVASSGTGVGLANTFQAVRTLATTANGNLIAAGSTLSVLAGNGTTYNFSVNASGTQLSISGTGGRGAGYSTTVAGTGAASAVQVSDFTQAANSISGTPIVTNVIAGALVLNDKAAGITSSANAGGPPALAISNATGDFVTGGGSGVNFTGGTFNTGTVTNNGTGAGFVNAATATVVSGTASATRSALESANTSSTGAVFTQTSTITITGGLGSQSFTAASGSTVQDFLSQVNSSSIGVTIGIDSATGKVLIYNNNYGLQGTDANGNTNSSGPAAVSVTGVSGDFGATGMNLNFNNANANIGHVNSTANFTGGVGQGAVNAVVTVFDPTTNNGYRNITATGVNGDQLQGSGGLTGIVVTLSNPGNITGVDAINVADNAALNLQASPNQHESIALSIDAQTTTALGISGLDLTTAASSQNALTSLTNAINTLSVSRTKLGVFTNQLTSALSNAGLESQNLQSARSQIRDANIATETINFTRDQILLQAGTSVLAQANQSPTGLLALLR